MKEVEFRAFKDGKMYRVGTLQWAMRSGPWWIKSRGFTAEEKEVNLTGCPLMMFTGVRDKKNKKIFEDDILMYPNDYPVSWEPPDASEPNNDFAIIEFLNGSFGGRVCQSRDSNTLGTWLDIEQLSDEYGEFQVIGNIHQNPEFVQEENKNDL